MARIYGVYLIRFIHLILIYDEYRIRFIQWMNLYAAYLALFDGANPIYYVYKQGLIDDFSKNASF